MASLEHFIRHAVRTHRFLSEFFSFRAESTGNRIHSRCRHGLDSRGCADEVDSVALLAHDAHVNRHGCLSTPNAAMLQSQADLRCTVRKCKSNHGTKRASLSIMPRRVVRFQKSYGKLLSASSNLSFLWCQINACGKPANIGEMLLQFFFRFAFHLRSSLLSPRCSTPGIQCFRLVPVFGR